MKHGRPVLLRLYLNVLMFHIISKSIACFKTYFAQRYQTLFSASPKKPFFLRSCQIFALLVVQDVQFQGVFPAVAVFRAESAAPPAGRCRRGALFLFFIAPALQSGSRTLPRLTSLMGRVIRRSAGSSPLSRLHSSSTATWAFISTSWWMVVSLGVTMEA